MKILSLNKRRAAALILCAALVFCALPLRVGATQREIGVSAKSAILMEASSELIIYEKNSRERLPMASTTKIMTALVALERTDVQSTVRVDPRAVGVEGSSVYLRANESVRLYDLLYALMLASANDAAEAIAYAVAGSIEDFSAMMNEKAAELRLDDTHFENPHGLPSKDHYTTAYDFARLSTYALKNENFKKICSTLKYTMPATDMEGARVIANHNKMLRIYGGAIGVKTGFTKKSGRCLVSAAEREGMTLIAVTLGAPDDWNDHKTMLNYGFSAYESVKLASKGEIAAKISLAGGTAEEIDAVFEEDVSVILPRSHGKITSEIRAKHFELAPIKAGQRLGEVLFFEGEKLVAKADIYASQDVAAKKFKKQRKFLNFNL